MTGRSNVVAFSTASPSRSGGRGRLRARRNARLRRTFCAGTAARVSLTGTIGGSAERLLAATAEDLLTPRAGARRGDAPAGLVHPAALPFAHAALAFTATATALAIGDARARLLLAGRRARVAVARIPPPALRVCRSGRGRHRLRGRRRTAAKEEHRRRRDGSGGRDPGGQSSSSSAPPLYCAWTCVCTSGGASS
jgi:hypothetical protein